MPTIAAINGHAFAAGFVLALGCDYRVMTSGRAWCSMNEVRFADISEFQFLSHVGSNDLRSSSEPHSYNHSPLC